MANSATFARHFARLVSLLMDEGSNVDEQKMSLRALATVNKNGPVSLATEDRRLLANDKVVPAALAGVREVASQMLAHSIRSVQFGAGSSAADLLGLARIIAGQSASGDGGARVKEKLAALKPKTIELTTAPSPASAETTSPAEQPAAPAAPAESTLSQPSPPRASTETPESPTGRRSLADDATSLLSQLEATDLSKLSPDELLKKLERAKSTESVSRLLDDLVAYAEQSARTGKTAVVADIFHGIVARDAKSKNEESKRAFGLAIRRLSKPALLRAIVTLIANDSPKKHEYSEVLLRTGEDGADAVIELITQAPTDADRTALLGVLCKLNDAVPSLTRMLGDSRWFVARNAADLLGEIVATEAEEALVNVLHHTDDRVRRSATISLLKLGTPEALRAVYDAIGDSSPAVRIQAAAAISTKRDARTATTLIRALEDEPDTDVQLAMIAALGKVGTTEAIRRLVKMALPEGRLFRKKDANLRIAAVQALGEAKTQAAIAALKDLVTDKDRDVRDTAMRALAHATR